MTQAITLLEQPGSPELQLVAVVELTDPHHQAGDLVEILGVFPQDLAAEHARSYAAVLRLPIFTSPAEA